MKLIFKIMIVFCVTLLSSCLDMFNNDLKEIGTHGLVLHHPSEVKGYFLGVRSGNAYEILIGPPVVLAEGNDSLILAKRASVEYDNSIDTIYYKIILSVVPGAMDGIVLDKQTYNNIRSRLNMKYSVSTNNKKKKIH